MTPQAQQSSMAQRLRAAVTESDLTIEALAVRTKVPEATIRSFLGEPVSAILPARAYLQGHWLLVARELGIDSVEARALFEQAHPPAVPQRQGPAPDEPRFSTGTMALAAGLGCIALLAVVLAFAF